MSQSKRPIKKAPVQKTSPVKFHLLAQQTVEPVATSADNSIT
jgi:hypothetical protein